ncbi:hypothetical protein [Paractinoplanes globisporus]|uniref:Uncharacterized protein n=1 Tax=Paractinoplanes globisporus TaxID=113565 RepID=A0ABW6W7K8_9ACTN|nr:hypothetical protein [Actinoplanes globisporus]
MGVDAGTNGDPERGAVLLIRVWAGPDPDSFRARLLRLDEGGAAGVPYAATANPDEVSRLVRGWLDEFLGRSSPPSG